MAAIVNISPLQKLRFVDSNGNALSGGLLFTYQAGTTTKQATYTDSTGTTANTNPIVLDSRGECNCWLIQADSYKFTLAPANDTDPPTSPIWTVDNVTTFASLNGTNSWAGTNTFAGNVNFVGSTTWLGTGQRLVADFSNGTIPNRAMFQTSVANGATEVGLVPNGSGGISGLSVFSDPNPANCAFGRLSVGAATGVLLESNIIGTGTQGPLRFAIGTGVEVGRWSTANLQFLINTTTESPVTGAKLRVNGIAQIDNVCAIAVHRNGVNQNTIATSTFTKAQLTTKRTDQNGNFDNVTNYRWTPPAGTYHILGNMQFTGLSANARTATLIYKNGSVLFSTNVYGTTGQASGAPAGGIDVANGSDYYELFVWHNSGNNETLSGNSQDTYLTGARLG